jgi:hypothetical protein
MPEQRNDFAPAVAASPSRAGRLIIAAIGAVSLSGLVFGGLLAPVSADDVTGNVGAGVSAEFDGDCVGVAAGGDGADGTGTSGSSVCLDDLGSGLPLDPGTLPGDLGGLVPDGLGPVLDLLDDLPALPGDGDNGAPGGNAGGGPAVSPSASESGAPPVVAGADEGVAQGDHVPGVELGEGLTGPSSGTMLITNGGTLPRTGGGLGSGLARMIAVLGFGRAAFALAGKRRGGPGRTSRCPVA